MTLTGLILMIFTSVFGFANSPSAFYLMGYSATPFYIVSALFLLYSVCANDGGDGVRLSQGRGRDLLVDEQQYRAALRVYWHVYVVLFLRGLDGQYGRQGVGAFLDVSLWSR